MLVFVRRASVVGFMLTAGLAGADNLRIATWNISTYNGSPTVTDAVKGVLYKTFEGRQMAPDVLFAQEMSSNSAAFTLRDALNNGTGVTDWQVSFGGNLSGINGTHDTAMFYRTSKVTNVTANLIQASQGTAGNPRDVYRFDFSVIGNAASNERFGVYNSHMKAGSTTTDQQRRLVEATAIRNNAASLAGNYQIFSVGDFNMQSSNQAAYQMLTGTGPGNAGRFFDPIGTPGSWNSNQNFKFVHTQDPVGAGGMDDRFDFILMGAGLGDGVGTEYVGSFGTPYSTTTWNDLNHSYRAYGNDGTSFNQSLRINGNTMVGASIAQDIVTAAGSGGHLPVFADISFEAVPEPATMLVLGSGVAALALKRRK